MSSKDHFVTYKKKQAADDKKRPSANYYGPQNVKKRPNYDYYGPSDKSESSKTKSSSPPRVSETSTSAINSNIDTGITSSLTNASLTFFFRTPEDNVSKDNKSDQRMNKVDSEFFIPKHISEPKGERHHESDSENTIDLNKSNSHNILVSRKKTFDQKYPHFEGKANYNTFSHFITGNYHNKGKNAKGNESNKVKVGLKLDTSTSNSYSKEERNSAVDDSLIHFNDHAYFDNGQMIDFLLEAIVDSYYNRNNCCKVLERPYRSYTLQQPLFQEGFEIILFPGSHLYERSSTLFHQCYSVKIKVPPGCAVLFADDLLHAGSSSRETRDTVQKDPVLVMYIKQEHSGTNEESSNTINLHGRSSSHGIGEGNIFVAECLCQNYYIDTHSSCTTCTNSAEGVFLQKIIDIDRIFNNDKLKTTSIGTVLIGNLARDGFIVYKSNSARNNLVSHVMRTISTTDGILENGDLNRRKLYSVFTKDLKLIDTSPSNLINNFVLKVFKSLASKVLKENTYTYQKPNILWFNGTCPCNEKPHYDYPEVNNVSK